jgi:hypothetical protein
MNKKVLNLVGVAVLVLTVALNVRHALNNYGVKTNKLHVEVLADTALGDTSGSGGTSADYCFMSEGATSVGTKIYICNSRTDATTIYPCPSSLTANCAGSSRDRCTK